MSTFGVTVASVRAHHFPQWAAFSAESSPDATTAQEMLDEAGADLVGALVRAGVATSDVAAGTAGYRWAAYTVRLAAALRILRASTQSDAKVEAVWGKALDTRLKLLIDGGSATLGNEALSPVDPDGPSSHITELSLDVGDESRDTSAAIHVLRRDDWR